MEKNPTCVDSALEELSQLQTDARLTCRMKDQIKTLEMELGFLKMYSWWLSMSNGALLGTDEDSESLRNSYVMSIIRKEIRKGQLYQSAVSALDKGEFEEWEDFVFKLLDKIQQCHPKIKQTCEELHHIFSRCLLSPSGIQKFLEIFFIPLDNLVRYYSYNLLPILDDMKKKADFFIKLFHFTRNRCRYSWAWHELREHIGKWASEVGLACLYLYSVTLEEKLKAENKEDKESSVASKLEFFLSLSLKNMMPYQPEDMSTYIKILTTSKNKSSPSDVLLMGEILFDLIDLLLESPVFHLKKDVVDNLREALIFLITFLVDSPKTNENQAGGKLILTRAKDVLSDISSYLASEIEEGSDNLILLRDLMQEVTTVKAKARDLYISDISAIYFPCTDVPEFIDSLLINLIKMLEYPRRSSTSLLKHQFSTLQEEFLSLWSLLRNVLHLQNEHQGLEDLLIRIANVSYHVRDAFNSLFYSGDSFWKKIICLSCVMEEIKHIKYDIKKIQLHHQMHDTKVINTELSSDPLNFGNEDFEVHTTGSQSEIFFIDSDERSEMAGDAAVGLLENLMEFVTYNAHLIGGLVDAKMLCDDLHLMNDLTKQFLGKNADSDFPEDLFHEIRGVVHKAEDAIEKYVIFKSKRDIWYPMDVTMQIIEARAKVSEFISAYKRYLWKDLVKFKSEKNEEVTTVEEFNLAGFEDAVGFKDETKKVIELLTGGSPKLEVICIIGMFGLGKTTLAKMVLRDPIVEFRFFNRVFVNVSKEYERKGVFLKILRAFTELTPELTAKSDVQLAEVLKEQLKTKNYLIVMDDVWTKEAWNDLKVAFPDNDRYCRVLITSRNNNVAFHANPNRDPHYLRFMAREDAQRLLRRKVFGEDNCPPELQEYEERILLKCAGLPLAIVEVADMLCHCRERNVWIAVAKDRPKISDEIVHQFADVIKLSYNNLPYHLRSCLLYLGVFPEEFEIPVWKLFRLWIAEGFILKDGNMMLEDIAEDYLEDLVDRNLVMVGQRRLNGQIKTCRIHDTLRDFCKKEAQKENLFREIKRFKQSTFLSEHPTLDDYRRICINAYVSDYITTKPSGPRVRSFLTSAKEETTLPLDQISSIPKAFRLLRVLDVRSIIFNRFPTELLSLVLLKYIALSSNFKVLPEKMANLRNLQTIIIETTSRTLEIKADIWKLALLRHLHTNASACLIKVKGESPANANLQTLSTISPESCRREVFDKTPKLKKLGIFGKLATVIQANGDSTLFDCIVKLGSLENLKLLNDDITNPLHALPRETNFPRKLMRLTISNTLLDWKYMSTLGKLENLEVLKLKENAFQGELWRSEDGGFKRLKVLHIGSMNLALWTASASHFPILTSLFIKHCNKLGAVPSAFADIPTLQLIDLYCTHASVAASARKIQLLKLQVQAQQKNTKSCMFKLSVYPPDQ